MKLALTIVIAAVIATMPLSATLAQESMPRLQMFKGNLGWRGLWKTEIIEGAPVGYGQMPPMVICVDSLLRLSAQHPAAKGEARCAFTTRKDSADEAVFDATCTERKSTFTYTRESATAVVVQVRNEGALGQNNLKARYSFLGPCRDGQGAVSFDANSDQCQKLRAQVDAEYPAHACAEAGERRAVCEQQMTDARNRRLYICK